MIKLIAIDLDGTLLTDGDAISDENIAAIEQAQRKGAHVVVSTGRNFLEAEFAAKKTGAVNYIITSNGCRVTDMKKDEILYNVVFPKETALEILEIIDSYKDVLCCLSVDEKTVCHSDMLNKFDKIEINKAWYEQFKSKIIFTDDMLEFIKDKDLSKIYIPPHLDPKPLTEIYSKIQNIKNLEISSSYEMSMDISYTKADKGTAVSFLAKHLGIDRTEIMAIGDNTNDISMIEYAGIGVAMENSSKLLLQAADYITSSNNENGVAHAIKRYVL